MLTHKGTITLTTPRLTLRRITPGDTQAMYENWASDNKTTRFMSWDTHESADVTRKEISKWVSEYEKPDFYLWVIEYDNTAIGTISLHEISDRNEKCEIGYCIGSKWWNKGIMTEAAAEVIRFAFEEINFHRICALFDKENIGSGRVIQKNGMKQEGLLRENVVRRDGTYGDMAYYAILKKEWKT